MSDLDVKDLRRAASIVDAHHLVETADKIRAAVTEIENFRRRVAELKGERDTALVTAEVAQAELLKCREVRNASHELQKLHFQESKRLHGKTETLAAENAALRGNAEIGELVKKLGTVKILKIRKAASPSQYLVIANGEDGVRSADLAEALRYAVKEAADDTESCPRCGTTTAVGEIVGCERCGVEHCNLCVCDCVSV